MRLEPVKEILRTRGSSSHAVTTPAASVVGTTLTTPAGTPASTSSRARARAVSGVSAAGLSTTVQPAARAGAIFRVAIAAGKFHGVTSAADPDRPVRDDRADAAGRGGAVVATGADRLLGEPAEELGGVGRPRARASVRDLPFSSTISSASSCWSRIIRSNVRCSISERSRPGVTRQLASAAFAASTAAAASAVSPSATWATTVRSAGFSTSKTPAPPGRKVPPTNTPRAASRESR